VRLSRLEAYDIATKQSPTKPVISTALCVPGDQEVVVAMAVELLPLTSPEDSATRALVEFAHMFKSKASLSNKAKNEMEK
jgi:hypothetical protein